MRWAISERRVLVRGLSERYRKAGKKEKGRMLDEFVEMTGYNRSYAAWPEGVGEPSVIRRM